VVDAFTGGLNIVATGPEIAGGAAIGGGIGYLAGSAVDWAMGASGSLSSRPPAGALPISETPWSGDHGSIKKQVGAGPADNVKIDPDDNVWVQNPDGSWTNYGPASDYTGSGKPNGRRGKDRGC
jgi:hypothetical protein